MNDNKSKIYQNLQLKVNELENKEDYENIMKICLELETNGIDIYEAFKVDKSILINEIKNFKDIVIANATVYAISKNKSIQFQNKKTIEELKSNISEKTIDLEGFNDIILTEIIKDNNSPKK